MKKCVYKGEGKRRVKYSKERKKPEIFPPFSDGGCSELGM